MYTSHAVAVSRLCIVILLKLKQVSVHQFTNKDNDRPVVKFINEKTHLCNMFANKIFFERKKNENVKTERKKKPGEYISTR